MQTTDFTIPFPLETETIVSVVQDKKTKQVTALVINGLVIQAEVLVGAPLTDDQQAQLDDLKFAALPRIGVQYQWEPALPYAAAVVEVVDVRWNGEEWWVHYFNLSDANKKTYGCELSRWVEATLVSGEK